MKGMPLVRFDFKGKEPNGKESVEKQQRMNIEHYLLRGREPKAPIGNKPQRGIEMAHSS